MTEQLYQEIVKSQEQNFNRDVLMENYAQSLVEGMDLDDLVDFAYEKIFEHLQTLNDDELVAEVDRNEPDLLDDVDVL